MQLKHSDEPLTIEEASLFLAGPTPRDDDVVSWRPEAVRILSELGFVTLRGSRRLFHL